ncbi:MAG: flagellar biosynthetic protein FliR [Phycisphaerales bacterium]|nr:flagellar biosynthetic protein FliR [Phycisphaerales bacterium]
MFGDLVPFYPLVAPFLLVLFRVAGLLAFAPFFNTTTIPGQVRALLALALAFCVWQVVPHAGVVPDNLIGLVAAIAGEMSVGLAIGLMLAAVFAGIQAGALMVSQQMGLSLATIYNPTFEDQSTVIEQLAFWLALMVFLAMGGHREIINAIVYSYQTVPMGEGGLSAQAMLNGLCGCLAAAYHAATRIAMPALVTFFTATLTNGLMARAMPQMNLMTMGISINLIVGFLMVGAGVVSWAAVSREAFQTLSAAIARLLNL